MSNPDTAPKQTDRPARGRLTIHRATESDLLSIAAIEQQSFPTLWNEETYRKELTRDIALFLVAKLDDEVVGYALSWNSAKELHVLKIAVCPPYRRMNIATALMLQSLILARKSGCEYCLLEVRESNIAAQKMYEKLGFKILGVHKKYYTDTDEDGIVLYARFSDKEQESEIA